MFKTKEGVLCFTTSQEKILFDALDEIYKLKGLHFTALNCDRDEIELDEVLDEWEVKSICEDAIKKLNDSL